MSDSGDDDERRDINVLIDGELTLLTYAADAGTITGIRTRDAEEILDMNVYDVLWADFEGRTLNISYVRRLGKGKSQLAGIVGKVVDNRRMQIREWCDVVLAAAYADVKRKRRLRILVNPFGGKGNARSIFSKQVEPILKAARCTYDITYTERKNHARDICARLPLTYDAVVVLSGDGLIHEIFNGFAAHATPRRAFAVPIAPVPTGSGNGTALNLLGLEDGFDVNIAALNAVKGIPMKQDICSLTLGNKRIFTFMTQSLGLMADLDLGTEHMRWLGDTRFFIGFLQGVLRMKPCPIRLSIKVAERDKHAMYATHRTSARRDTDTLKSKASEEALVDVEEVGTEAELPSLNYHHDAATREDDGWVTIDEPILYLYAGKSPYVGRDLLQFPVAHASDGLIDIVVQRMTTRGEMLRLTDGAEKGKGFWSDTQHYFKAHAYRVTPLAHKGNFSIDGEAFPLRPFQVEVHRGLGTFLSPLGRYAHEFDVPPPAPVGPDRAVRHGEEEDGEEEGHGCKSPVRCCFP